MITEEIVLTKLKLVLDPELGINIVDLGLVYAVNVVKSDVTIDLTLTSPGCPLIKEFLQNANEALLAIDGIGAVVVNLVFDPLWTPANMSAEAAEELGFLL